jgi:hypothetical protein
MDPVQQLADMADITGLEQAQCSALLEAFDWNMEAAVDHAFSGAPPPIAPLSAIAPAFGGSHACNTLEWAELFRLQDNGLARVTRVRISGCIATVVLQKNEASKRMHFSSIFLGINLRTHLATCCYIMDEPIEDAIFRGSCLVAWKAHRICVFDAADPSRLVPTQHYKFGSLYVINAEWLDCDPNLGPHLQIWLSKDEDGSIVEQACLWCLAGGIQDVWLDTNSMRIEKKNFNLMFSTNLKVG